MLGALIGDLAAWTWVNEHDSFYPKLVSDNALLSVYGHALLRAASRNVVTDSSVDISPSGSPTDGLRYYGQWLMWHVVSAWTDDDMDADCTTPKDLPHFYSVGEEEEYARLFLTKIIKKLRTGATKAETLDSIRQFNGLTGHRDWKTAKGDESILSHLFRAWDCFYRGFDLTSCLHNAQAWSGDRELLSVLTGAIAGTMYGSDYMYLKEKYAGKHEIAQFLGDLLISSCVKGGYDNGLVLEMHELERRERWFFPKNNARTNVERHKFEAVDNPFENVRFSDNKAKLILRAFYTDWENRFGFYLDDGWVYSYRSFVLLGRFKLLPADNEWRIDRLEMSGVKDYKMFLTAINCALSSCRPRRGLL